MAEAHDYLRAIHLFFAVMWGGAVVYRALVVEKLGRSEKDVADAIHARSISGPFLGVTGLLFWGFGLAAMLTHPADGAYSKDALGDGFFLFHGALGLATLALLSGFLFHLPNDLKLKALVEADDFGDEYERRRSRSKMMSHVTLGLTLAAMFGMAFFRAVAA